MALPSGQNRNPGLRLLTLGFPFKVGGRSLCLLGIAVCATLLFCGQKQMGTGEKIGPKGEEWNRSSAELEYRLIRTELLLAKSDEAYLVLDMQQRKLELKLKGVVVWDCPMRFPATDSLKLQEFAKRFRSREGKLLRPVAQKHLFAAAEKTPDSVLAIVGEAAEVDPELLQRHLPEHFQLRWGHTLRLEVRSEIQGKPVSIFKNAIVGIRRLLYRPFGETSMVLRMESEEALTFYRAVYRGMPTLIYPRLEAPTS